MSPPPLRPEEWDDFQEDDYGDEYGEYVEEFVEYDYESDELSEGESDGPQAHLWPDPYDDGTEASSRERSSPRLTPNGTPRSMDRLSPLLGCSSMTPPNSARSVVDAKQLPEYVPSVPEEIEAQAKVKSLPEYAASVPDELEVAPLVSCTLSKDDLEANVIADTQALRMAGHVQLHVSQVAQMQSVVGESSSSHEPRWTRPAMRQALRTSTPVSYASSSYRRCST